MNNAPFWFATNDPSPLAARNPYSGLWTPQAQLIDLAPGDTTTGPTSAAVNFCGLYPLAQPTVIGSYGFAARSGGALNGYTLFGSVGGSIWDVIDSSVVAAASYNFTKAVTVAMPYNFYQLVVYDPFAGNAFTDFRIYDTLGAELYGLSGIEVPTPTINVFGLTSGGVPGIAVQGT